MSQGVVSFGETMLRLSPLPGTRLEETRVFYSYVAGAESNVLACLARLGVHCSWSSALPANPLGRHVAAELQRHGVDTSQVVWLDGSARLGTYYAEESASPLGVQVYYDRANSACALLDPDTIDLSLLDGAQLLHLSGITPALSERANTVFFRLLQAARERQVSFCFDVNYRAKLWSPQQAAIGIMDACRAADLLFCTRADAGELWDFRGKPDSILRQMAEHFGERKTIVLTLGSEGAAQLSEGLYTVASAFPSNGTVRFGSGDAFAAGYLYAYLGSPVDVEMQWEPGISPLTFGNAVAALKRCIAGDIAVVTLDDVRALIHTEGVRFR